MHVLLHALAHSLTLLIDCCFPEVLIASFDSFRRWIVCGGNSNDGRRRSREHTKMTEWVKKLLHTEIILFMQRCGNAELGTGFIVSDIRCTPLCSIILPESRQQPRWCLHVQLTFPISTTINNQFFGMFTLCSRTFIRLYAHCVNAECSLSQTRVNLYVDRWAMQSMHHLMLQRLSFTYSLCKFR